MKTFAPNDRVRLLHTVAGCTLSGTVMRAGTLHGKPAVLVQIDRVDDDGEPQETQGFSFLAEPDNLEHIEG
jgi:hypothetical protein